MRPSSGLFFAALTLLTPFTVPESPMLLFGPDGGRYLLGTAALLLLAGAISWLLEHVGIVAENPLTDNPHDDRPKP